MRKNRLLKMQLFVLLMLFVQFAFAQQGKTITGTVTDDKGAALAGASITAKGLTTGANTAANGEFKLTVPTSVTTLIVSFVGFENQEVSIKNTTNVTVSLRPDNGSLNEVVVVGYGTQKRKDVTGSVSSVKGDQIRSLPVPSIS